MKLVTYKKVDIDVDSNGIFTCCVNKNGLKSSSLDGLKQQIDKQLGNYFHITKMDYDKMLAKLSDREKDFLNELMESYDCHRYNAYCELGDTMENFEVDWREIVKIEK